MPIKQEPSASMVEMKRLISEQISDLLDKHEDKYLLYMEQAETKKVGLTFSVQLDFTESNASLETSIRYSQVVKDKRVAEITDPDQVEMFPRPGEDGEVKSAELTVAETMKRHKKRQRAKDVEVQPEE